jgi:hypothetical protein
LKELQDKEEKERKQAEIGDRLNQMVNVKQSDV